MNSRNTKNILILVSGSGAQGGAEKQLIKLANNLKSFSLMIVVLNPNKKFISSIKNDSIELVYNLENKLTSFKKLIKIIKEKVGNTDKKIIVQGWLPKGNLIAFIIAFFINKKSSIFFSHRNSFFIFQSIQSQLIIFLTLLLPFIARKKIVHIANSYSIYKYRFIRSILGKRKFVINNGFLINKIEEDKITLSSQNKILKLLYVARFSPEKGHLTLLKALKKLNFKYTITLVGSGCSKKNKFLIKSLSKIGCEYKIYETYDDIDSLYRESNYTLLFSRSEASPNVLVESMRQGTPCITTPVGNTSEMVGKYGWVTNDFSVNSVIRDLHKANIIFENYSKYNKLRLNCYRHISKIFSLDEMILNYKHLYKKF